jgi:very-short-patch-repair endonuclease
MRDRKTIARARELRSNPTDAERRLWHFLRNNHLGCRFRRQHPIGPYIAEFASLRPRIVIEVDGGQHAVRRPYDTARDRYIESEGFFVLWFWSSEVLRDTNAVLEVIWREIRQQRARDAWSPP